MGVGKYRRYEVSFFFFFFSRGINFKGINFKGNGIFSGIILVIHSKNYIYLLKKEKNLQNRANILKLSLNLINRIAIFFYRVFFFSHNIFLTKNFRIDGKGLEEKKKYTHKLCEIRHLCSKSVKISRASKKDAFDEP